MKTQVFVKPSKPIGFSILAIEFLGLFALTYIGSWAVIFNNLGMVTENSVALAHAFVILLFTIFAINVSGAHLNPAITIGLIFIKRIGWTDAAIYIGTQYLGAIVGAFFLSTQLEDSILDKIKNKSVLGIPTPTSNDFEISGFWSEIFGMLLIMWVFMSLILDAKRYKTTSLGPPAIAFAIYISSMTFGEISGAGFNPARSLGPAIVSGKISKIQFIHFFGPIIGAVISSLLYQMTFVDEDDDERDELPIEVIKSNVFNSAEPGAEIIEYSEVEIENLK